MADRTAHIVSAFRGAFGGTPTLIARAPGRVELMGSHTDYNLGRVLTLPVDRDTWIAARPRADRRLVVRSLDVDASATDSLDGLAPRGDWADYVRGVAQALGCEGLAVGGVDAVVHSTVPLGGGLSSSASLECAMAVVWQALGGWHVDPVRLARSCQRAENEFVGVNCGVLDQMSACVDAAGGALWLDCRTLATRPAPMAAGVAVVVCDTRAPRRLAASEYGHRRAECEDAAARLGVAALADADLERIVAAGPRLPAPLANRARFIVEENARVEAFAEALRAGNRAALGHLADDSFRGACDLFEIGSPEMAAMMDAMRAAPGFIGGRQSGAGFGGCLVAFVDTNATAAFAAAATARYLEATGLSPEVFEVRPGAPAGLIA